MHLPSKKLKSFPRVGEPESPKLGPAYENGAAAGGGGLTWPKNQGFRTFSVISGLWRDQWRAACISTILTFHGIFAAEQDVEKLTI